MTRAILNEDLDATEALWLHLFSCLSLMRNNEIYLVL